MEANRLSQVVRQKAREFEDLCEKVDENTASRAPEGRWSPKQIVSHLLGPEGAGLGSAVRTILEQDNPTLDVKTEDPFFSEKRANTPFAELMREFEREYDDLADLVNKLSQDQLNRKVRIPAFKETPLGEYPTLGVFIQGIVEYHLTFHLDHMQEILQALGDRAA
ncbi:MAG: DinB superfamily protein [Syntrophorhabdaceae bacterium PtaU1.Bin034]|nr:MAG: DinB superfamily protein [Syntrophorhabdaceae bacterium PtaU1.Bin034]